MFLSCPPHSLINGLDKMYALMGDSKSVNDSNLNDFVAKIGHNISKCFSNWITRMQFPTRKFLGKSCYKMQYGADKEKFRKELQEYVAYCIKDKGAYKH